MEQLSVERLWHERWRTPWFQYSDVSGFHTGWYEDNRSLEAKLELMQEYHLRGFAGWRLGVEDPKFWTLAAARGRTGQQNQKRRPHRPETRTALGAGEP